MSKIGAGFYSKLNAGFAHDDAATKDFNSFDEDADGALTPEEFQVAVLKRKQQEKGQPAASTSIPKKAKAARKRTSRRRSAPRASKADEL
eukprot:CAMPEP_0119315334 /NCGR_PEP_ID=MMETSP1333-20130426/35387_1 /TAXON_ID=418940 /ORGANISM="Scyphosphaera apsteinii, Strain RCC1455" /LENGTH=89 /DNA_ID=CAMNT_0007320655 /DNA_START=236 /DNA_END=505 /DNA_ORIENTATION=-